MAIRAGLIGYGLITTSCADTPTRAERLLEQVPGFHAHTTSCAVPESGCSRAPMNCSRAEAGGSRRRDDAEPQPHSPGDVRSAPGCRRHRQPIAPTSAAARGVIAEGARRGLMLTVFHNRRWDGDFTLRPSLRRRIGDAPLRVEFERWRPTGQNWRQLADPKTPAACCSTSAAT
jgi:hypothetical protein